MKKRITLSFVGILFTICCICAQEVTRGQLMDLHFRAPQAKQAGNIQEALQIYKTILSVDASLPMPYLRLAEIYAMDRNNEKSIAAAAALYRKFLLLQPDDEEAANIIKEIAYLEQLTSLEVDLVQLLHIEQADAQHIFATRARRGITNREELEQHVIDVNLLYNQAQATISAGNVQGSIQQLEMLLQQIDPTNPLYALASMQLAEMYGKQGNLQKMREILASVERNMGISENLSQHFNLTTRDVAPFEDDMVGIWVSDLSFDIDGDALPFLAIQISRDRDGSFRAVILPHCTFAQNKRMYQGRPFNLSPVRAEGTGSNFLAHSFSHTVVPEDEVISFSFGNERFIRGISETTVQILTSSIDDATEAAVRSIAYTTDDFWKQTGRTVVVTIISEIIKGLTAQASVDRKRSVHIAATMERIFPGVATLNLVTTNILERTDGFERESADNIQMRMYKLYPEYNIVFADRGNEFFGYRRFSEEEIKQSEQYELLRGMRRRGYFNRMSYRQLEQRVLDYCWAKAEENPNMKEVAAFIMESFEHAKRGLVELNYESAHSTFQGWIDQRGRKTGKGVLSSAGFQYVGAFENDSFTFGTLTLINPRTGMAEAEYTGSFSNNRFHGNGIFIFADGRFLNGTWRRDEFREGKGTHEDGIFTGRWRTIRGEERIVVPHGRGTFVSADGEIITGTWRNGVLTNQR